MKERLRKRVMLLILAGALALTLCGCGEKNDTPENTGTEDTADEEPEAIPDEEAETSKKPEEASIMGEVQEIGEGQFVISEIVQEELEDGISMAVETLNEEDMNLITVFYDEDTVFCKRTIKDGGASYEDSESTVKELVKGAVAELHGSYEGESFHASGVQIMEVI